MATSPDRGISSSVQLLRSEETLAACRALAKGPRLRPILEALGNDADPHLVGGTVRDLASSQTACDIDLASVLVPEDAVRRCASAGLKVVETGLKHGTITIVHGGEHVELTTFRAPGAHAVNQYASSALEDLGGRDFTINALAVSLRTFELLDPYAGLRDLQDNVLRAVEDPRARFAEDPLRLLRLVRFGPAAGRTVEQKTLIAAQEAVGRLADVSVERINSELKRILVCSDPVAGIRFMLALGILAQIAPELLTMVGVSQNEFHTEDVFDHTMTVLARCPPDPMLRLVALFHDAGKPATISTGDDGRRHFYEHEVISESIARVVMERLKFSNDEIDQVTRLVRMHMRPIECGAPGVRRILRDVAPFYPDWRIFKYADAPPVMTETEVQERLGRFDAMVEAERVRVASQGSRLAISGRDLIEIGFPPGVRMGQFLKECEELVIEKPELNERERLLSRAKELLSTTGGAPPR